MDISRQVIEVQRCDASGENSTPRCQIQLKGERNNDIGFGYNGNGPGTYCNASAYVLATMVPLYGFPFKDDWAGIMYPIVAFQNFEYKISHLATKKFGFELLSANVCAMYACVKTYNVSIIDGHSRQDVIDVWYNDTQPGRSYGSNIVPLYLNPPNTTNKAYLEGPYSLNGETQLDLAMFLSSKFRGLISVSDTDNLLSETVDLRLIYAQGNFSRVIQNIALSLTDYIQTSPGSEAVPGNQSFTEIYIHIRWDWLSLPVAVAILSALFLLLSMYATRTNGATLWGPSNLALLYHGFEHPPAQDGYPLDNLRDMDRLAGVTRAKLQRDETGNVYFVVSNNTADR